MSILFTPPVADCDAPVDVVVTPSGTDMVVTWAAVPAATDYRVYVSAEAYGTYTDMGLTGGALSYTDPGGLAAGRKFYKVVAVCE